MNPTDPSAWHVLATLAGGVGLFLLGMTLLTDGLKALAGTGLRRALQRATGRTLNACASGLLMTVVTQASSATVLATIGFVTAGILTLGAAIPVVVGATVGTTSTTWLVATVGLTRGVSMVLLPALALGAAMRALGTGRLRQGGTSLAGLALLLYSIGFVRDAVSPAAGWVDLSQLNTEAMGGRMALVGIGLLLGALMQSSAAVIAVAIVALHDGAIGWDAAAHLCIGATIGTTSTGLFATLGGRAAARRTAAAWTLCALVQALMALAFFTPLKAAAAWCGELAAALGAPQDGAVSIAAFHTGFTLLGAAPVVLLSAPLARLLQRVVPQRGSAPPVLVLDRSALSVPGVAAATARRGIIEAGRGVTLTSVALLRGAQLRTIDERLDDSLASLGAARDFIGEIQVPEGDQTTLELQLATVGALDHFSRMVGDMQHLLPVVRGEWAMGPELRGCFSDATAALEVLAAWLTDSAQPSPAAQLAAQAKALSARRSAERGATLARTAAGATAPETAMAQLEALRQVDRLVHHAAKAAEYLSVRSNGSAGPQAKQHTPAQDIRDEPT